MCANGLCASPTGSSVNTRKVRPGAVLKENNGVLVSSSNSRFNRMGYLVIG